MKEKWIATGICLLFFSISQGQVSRLTLDGCQKQARENYPLIKQYGLIDLSQDYNLSNLSKGYLPQLALNAQATYQSDVVHFPLSIPGIDIPSIDKDQYKAVVDVSQTIWDGGNIRAQRKITQAGKDVDRQTIEVQLYTIRERVNQLYFGILTVDEQLNQLYLLREDLQSSLKMVRALQANGVGTQSDVDAVQVELLSTGQRETELQSFRKAYLQMLAAMIDEKIDNNTSLEKPSEQIISPQGKINRPELNLYDSQRSLFDTQKSMVSAKNMPKFSFFLQGGYGKPGLNMLSNQFEVFGMGGIRMSWNFGNLYTTGNEKKLIATNLKTVDTQQETFLFNTNLQLIQTYNEVLKSQELMEKDNEIIRLRNRVKTASESKYENGVYTVNDLLKDIHAESQARQARILHEVQYLMNIYNYKNIQGN